MTSTGGEWQWPGVTVEDAREVEGGCPGGLERSWRLVCRGLECHVGEDGLLIVGNKKPYRHLSKTEI